MDSSTVVKILLVDDRPENLLALEAILDGLGYELVRAESGEEALKQVLRHDFAVILLDVQMPGMNGFETAELIKNREKSRHVPIIFLTAISKDDAYVFAGYAAGAVDYLFKPFNPDILRSKVAVFVDLWEKTVQLQRQSELLREAEARDHARQIAEMERENLRQRNMEVEAEVAERTRELAEANRRLTEADQYKDEFLSVISHELRTPLNFIMGFASILEDEVAGPMSEGQHDYLQRILYGAERMLHLVDDLLDFAKVQAGKLVLMPRPVAYAGLVTEVLDTLKPLAERKGIAIEAEIAVEASPCLDDQRIAQVLTNLVSNAIKFTPQGGSVRVKAWAADHCVVTEVIDSGVGIAAEDLPSLFVRFKQLDMSATREAGGTGLGLSITRAMVEAHGGSIEATSPGVGHGATFRFKLPLEAAPTPTAPEVPSATAESGPNATVR